ncbi:MAG: hypothetical protein K2R98_07850 [Gemmataceae bacterium]|nr:hypothetical protein [Gemmataceae bacterium]
MDSHPEPQHSPRATLLTVLMLTVIGAISLVFCLGVAGTMVFSVVGIVAVFAAFGFCHYLLWGRSFSKQVLVEQEEDDASTPEAEGWRRDGPHRPGRF